jgi:hypothetical protein
VWVCGEIAARPRIALPEQAFRWAELFIHRVFSSVKLNVGVFSDHDIN